MFCFVLCLLLLFVFLSSLPDGLVILVAVFDDGLRSHWYCTETKIWPCLASGLNGWGLRFGSPRVQPLAGDCHTSLPEIAEWHLPPVHSLVGETNCRAAGHSRSWPRCDTDSGPSALPVVTRDQVSSAPTDIDSTELKQLTNSNTLLEF